MQTAVAERKERKRFDTAPTPDAPRGRSPITGAPVPAGRPKGIPNKATRTIRDAIEAACAPGGCHPKGLAGWLIERAQGGVQDRQIFATFVAKIIPAQLQASVSADIVVQLPWLQARNIGSRTHPRTQPEALEAQVVETQGVLTHDLRVDDPTRAAEPVQAGRAAAEISRADPHPPLEPAAGGPVE